MPLLAVMSQPALASPPWSGTTGADKDTTTNAGVIGIYAPTSQSFTYSDGAGIDQLTYSGSAGQSASGTVGINNNAGVTASVSTANSLDASANAKLDLQACGTCGENTLNNVLGFGAEVATFGGGSLDSNELALATVSGDSNSNIANTTEQTATKQMVTTVSTSDSTITGVGADSSLSAASTSSFEADINRTAITGTAGQQDTPVATASASAQMVLGSTAATSSNSSSFNSVFIQAFEQ